jgi:hypothetical protein
MAASGGVTLGGLAVAAIGVVAIGGCTANDVYRTRLRSGNPLERSKAVVALAERGDAESVHTLVDMLEDRDPAVRMFTIAALKRLSGKDYGYRYYHDETRRLAAVDRWRHALRTQDFVIHPPGDEIAAGGGASSDGGDGAGSDGSPADSGSGRARRAVEQGGSTEASMSEEAPKQDSESP